MSERSDRLFNFADLLGILILVLAALLIWLASCVAVDGAPAPAQRPIPPPTPIQEHELYGEWSYHWWDDESDEGRIVLHPWGMGGGPISEMWDGEEFVGCWKWRRSPDSPGEIVLSIWDETLPGVIPSHSYHWQMTIRRTKRGLESEEYRLAKPPRAPEPIPVPGKVF